MTHIILWCLAVFVGMNLGCAVKMKKQYDYIILGGGTAGCVVAGRLSEDADKSVLVLEAGPDDADFLNIDVPAAVPTLEFLTWGYLSESLTHAGQELIDNKTKLLIGKVLGGSASMNRHAVVRGSRHDYDHWEALGNEGWGYDDVLPYFKKSETMEDAELAANGFHGTMGPWTIKQEDSSRLSEVFIQAGEELGFDDVDYNGPNQEGFANMQVNIKQGRRDSTVDAYIRSVIGRRNLHIKTNAFVTKIEFKNKKAVGVHYTENGKSYFVKVKKEVIVSAGALNSPKVLMLSGIGPKDDLENLGIEVIADLPVGQNLQDHIATYLPFFINESLSVTPETTNTFEALANYVFFGEGYWARSGLSEVCFVRSDTRPVEDNRTHLQLIPFHTLYGYDDVVAAGASAGLNIDPELFNALHDTERGKQGFTFYVVLLHPRDTGLVQLKNKDPNSEPIVTLNFLKNAKDVEEMVEGIRFAQALTQTKPYRELDATLTFPPHPACTHITYDTDQYWECFIRQKSFSFVHYTSTCRMSPGADGVVDNRLRVKGLKNLRVVDASVMPHITSGNVMAPVVMIAEKAADMIKEDAE